MCNILTPCYHLVKNGRYGWMYRQEIFFVANCRAGDGNCEVCIPVVSRALCAPQPE